MKPDHYITTFDTIDMRSRRIPVMRLDGDRPGPVLWLVANCHGDEVTGIEVIHRVLDTLQCEGLQRGTLYALPLMNPSGAELIERNVPIDNNNLNRSYPGKKDGEYTERLADLIYTEIISTQPELVIDLHTTETRSIPYVILDRVVDEEADPDLPSRLAAAAQLFGISVVYDYAPEEYKKQRLDQSLPGSLLNKAHLLAYTVELGPTRMITKEFVQVGVHGVLNVLRHLGLLQEPGAEHWMHYSKITAPGVWRRDPEIRANTTGIIQFLVEQGSAVEAGQDLARIKNILGEVIETIPAKHRGYVLELADRGVAFPGVKIMSVAIPDE